MSRNFSAASSQYLSVSAAVVTDVPLTMACWFRANDVTADRTLMVLGDTTDGDPRFELLIMGAVAGDPVQASTANILGETNNANTTTGYSANTWHHACGVWASATDRRAFIDGGSKGTNTTSTAVTGLDTLRIGTRLAANARFMDGLIAEAAIWNVALSDGEVKALGSGCPVLSVRPGSIVAYYPLYGIASPEVDYTVNRKHLTVTNGPTQGRHAPVQSAWGNTESAIVGGSAAFVPNAAHIHYIQPEMRSLYTAGTRLSHLLQAAFVAGNMASVPSADTVLGAIGPIEDVESISPLYSED